jgi:DNA-directed RNA polymerase specialized sigma24 family protein
MAESGKGLAVFLDLIRPWERHIYLISLALGGSPELAEAIASETIWRAFSRRHVPGSEHLCRFLIRLAISVGSERTTPDQSDSARGAGAHVYLGSDGRMTKMAVATAWLNRPQRDRVVLVLRDTLHFSTSETASILDISEIAVRESLSNARLGILCTPTVADPVRMAAIA